MNNSIETKTNPFEKQVNNSPFAEQLKTLQDNSPFSLGTKSDKPDTYEEDMQGIKDIIPQESNNNIEEGFQKMLNIMEKSAPRMPDIKQNTTSSVFDTFKQPPQEKPVASNETPDSNKNSLDETEDKTEVKEKTKSEELGLNFKDEEILPLIDSLLTKGYASETTTLRGYNITFRTSYLWEDQEVVSRTDAKIADLTLNASGTFFYDMYALAANLEQFGANYFKPVNRGKYEDLMKSFNDRVEFLEGLPSPFINILMKKKIEFLKKVQFLLDNYERLLQAF